MQWYYAENGEANGPLSDEELRAAVTSGQIEENTLVWHQGMKKWIAVATIPELSEFCLPATPAPFPLPKSKEALPRITKRDLPGPCVDVGSNQGVHAAPKTPIESESAGPWSRFLAGMRDIKKTIVQPQKPNPYFSQLKGAGSLLFVGFSALVYGLGTLATHGHIDLSTARALVSAYWVASLLWFAVFIGKSFCRFYRYFIGRLRLYEPDEIALRHFLVFVLFIAVAFYPWRYSDFLDAALNLSSMRQFLASYGCTLFLVLYLYGVIVHIVAKLRGIDLRTADRKEWDAGH